MQADALRPVWLVRGGKHGQDEAAALDEGLAIIGFTSIPDLSHAKTREDLLAVVRTQHPNDRESRIQNFASQLGAFVLRMAEGDIIAMPRKTTGKVALGRVSGPYRYKEVNGAKRHTRQIDWLRPDVPRQDFQQDLLYSLGAFMTVCRVKRNDADRRIAAILGGGIDPGSSAAIDKVAADEVEADEAVARPDIAQMAHDQIRAHIESTFVGHDLSRLVEAVLRAEGYATRLSPPGPDGGVDILCGQGPLGFDSPRLCVQVKSSTSASDVTIFRALQGTMQSFGAERGLLVCWGGFTRALLQEARQHFFNIRLWDSGDIVDAVYRTYERLPEEFQTELPLKRVWTLVLETDES